MLTRYQYFVYFHTRTSPTAEMTSSLAVLFYQYTTPVFNYPPLPGLYAGPKL